VALRRGTRRRRGFALADFFTGTVVFAGAMVAFATMTRSKMETIDQAATRHRALAVAEATMDEIRRAGSVKIPEIKADSDGFSEVRHTDSTIQGIGKASIQIDARSARVVGGRSQGLLEVRVRVRWKDATGPSYLQLSTLARRAP
jgi:hypothetical protein